MKGEGFLIFWSLVSGASLFAVAKNPSWPWMLLSFALSHGLGHMVFARMVGVKTGPRVYKNRSFFRIELVENPYKRWKDFFIATGGPIFTLVFLFGFAFFAKSTLAGGQRTFLKGLAAVNLLNLFPAYPLDGGHMLYAWGFSITKRFRILGKIISLLALLPLIFLFKIPFPITASAVLYIVFGGKLPPQDLKGERMNPALLFLFSFSYLLLLLLSLAALTLI